MKLFLDPEGLINGALGGALIGLSSSALLVVTGETLGISGILGSMLRGQDLPPRRNSGFWRISFISGVLSAGGLIASVLSPVQMTKIFGEGVKLTALASIVGGFAVGLGTRFGNGCTSGHGVCGLPRGSPRSLLSVMTFMTFGALSAYFCRSEAGRSLLYSNIETSALRSFAKNAILPLVFGISSVSSIWSAISSPDETKASQSTLFSSKRIIGELSVYSIGLLMGLGLSLSGMSDPNKVLRFLDFTGKEGFDPQLMMVMASAVLFHGTCIQVLTHFFSKSVPVLTNHLSSNKPSFDKIISLGLSPANTKFDLVFLMGSAIFGIGWGIAGGCPGPLLVGGGSLVNEQSSLSLLGVILGMIAYEALTAPSSTKINETKSS
jgi:uncharacterized membrane protein YedE/YeeE